MPPSSGRWKNTKVKTTVSQTAYFKKRFSVEVEVMSVTEGKANLVAKETTEKKDRVMPGGGEQILCEFPRLVKIADLEKLYVKDDRMTIKVTVSK